MIGATSETYRDKENTQLAVEIKNIFDDEKQRVGLLELLSA